ncbi:hypothetical protein ACA29_01110 [Lederbergia galactosidilytica]|nr:hypothetical protein ACA29_01110 [Lederbergia galactosidilytica]
MRGDISVGIVNINTNAEFTDYTIPDSNCVKEADKDSDNKDNDADYDQKETDKDISGHPKDNYDSKYIGRDDNGSEVCKKNDVEFHAV